MGPNCAKFDCSIPSSLIHWQQTRAPRSDTLKVYKVPSTGRNRGNPYDDCSPIFTQLPARFDTRAHTLQFFQLPARGCPKPFEGGRDVGRKPVCFYGAGQRFATTELEFDGLGGLCCLSLETLHGLPFLFLFQLLFLLGIRLEEILESVGLLELVGEGRNEGRVTSTITSAHI